MLNFLSSLISSGDIAQEQQPAIQKMLRNILYIVILASSLISIVDGIIFGRPATLYSLGFLAIIAIVSAIYLRNQVLWPARIVIPLGTLVSISYIILAGNGLHDIGISGFGIVIILAALTLGGNGLIVFGLLSTLAITIIGIAEMNGYVAYPLGLVGVSDIVIISTIILAGAFVLRFLMIRLQQTISQLYQSEQEQKKANAELRGLKDSLENRVTERTTELENRNKELDGANSQIQRRATQFEALAQVSQSIASIRDLQELLSRVATVISENFGFYHVGLFLLDPAGEYAILSATNSEGGKKMIQRKHRLRVGAEGIVGNVTATGGHRIALDVGKDAVYFNNAELPDTHSEMALPLRSGDRIIGALDVQSIETGAFTEQDVQTLSLLAGQVSLAIENARLFEEVHKALIESEMANRQATREAWRRLPEQQRLIGYRYSVSGSAPLRELVNMDEIQVANQNGETDTGSIVFPIELRGEVIGTLRVQSPSARLSDDQRDLVKAVADRVALSAENARLFEETNMRAERERKVSDITSKIRSHNDPQAMIETAINELRIALQATKVEIIPQAMQGDQEKKAQV